MNQWKVAVRECCLDILSGMETVDGDSLDMVDWCEFRFSGV